ncbi:hypothetical protein Trydic_g13720 [Trypoxylus dichotomus]
MPPISLRARCAHTFRRFSVKVWPHGAVVDAAATETHRLDGVDVWSRGLTLIIRQRRETNSADGLEKNEFKLNGRIKFVQLNEKSSREKTKDIEKVEKEDDKDVKGNL